MSFKFLITSENLLSVCFAFSLSNSIELNKVLYESSFSMISEDFIFLWLLS